ncbi:hypothetical protein BFS06_13845 [Clostridium perfringens]|uniref:hypothetical protein n=1 Tax=Clostridium perfringens TaxID=1502 RepID=UPI00103FAB1C|nr:hypothetical protein [Clostridium perfringens]TBX14288.1 hypothetical protein BFS06_13845 [Clostridium perfringens]
MEGFKFKRIKDRFIWESNFMVLEFSSPRIQTFSDYIHLKDETEIMYYYYTVKVFKKIEDYDKNDKIITKYKLVTKRNVYDFPCITELKAILEYQLKDDTTMNGQKIKYNSGDIHYSKVMATEGFACDDFYEIKKIINTKNKKERYVVYVGTTYDFQGDLNSVGIRTPYVERADIEELLKCVSEFIKYSIDMHNRGVDNCVDNYKVKGNKIYKYDEADKDKLEAIYAVGDILDITTVVDNTQFEYNKTQLVEANKENIVLSDGTILNSKTIVYMNNKVSNEMLNYNENQIAEEFVALLNDEEVGEFIKYDSNHLLHIYKMAIIRRTSMCVESHNFNMNYKNGDRVEAVTPIVKDVIDKIKLILQHK